MLLPRLLRKPLLLSATDEETPVSATSMKVRAMASFICMAMLEPLLASGLPMEKILDGGADMNGNTEPMNTASDVVPSTQEVLLEQEIPTLEHQREGDRKFALQDEFSPSTSTSDAQLEKEIGSSLHKKEGDRIVALQDGFAPEEPDSNPTPLPTAVATVTELNGVENVPGNDDTSMTAPNFAVNSPLSPFSLNTETPHLIPPVPSAISTAFGRALPVTREHVLPLQQERAPSAEAVANRVVADEDPYGE